MVRSWAEGGGGGGQGQGQGTVMGPLVSGFTLL